VQVTRFHRAPLARVRSGVQFPSGPLPISPGQKPSCRRDRQPSPAAGLLDRALGLLEGAEAEGDLRGATGALKECRATVELLVKLKPSEHCFDDMLTPNPIMCAGLIEVAAREFRDRPLEAEQFASELLQAYVHTLKPWIPLLGGEARERLVDGIRTIEMENEDR
jgi:hypothetical protein